MRNTEHHVKEIKEYISDYKKASQRAKRHIVNCERMRTRIFNMIENAEVDGLDKRMANMLMERLTRPYAIDLTK